MFHIYEKNIYLTKMWNVRNSGLRFSKRQSRRPQMRVMPTIKI